MNKTNLGRVLFVLTIAALACALYLLLSAPALADYVGSQAFGDKREYLIYDDTERSYDGALGYAIEQMNRENARFDGRGIAVRLTTDQALADTIVTDSPNANGWLPKCEGTARTRTGPDIIRLNPACLDDPRRNPPRILLHALMHTFGFGHVTDCRIRSLMSYHCGPDRKYDTLQRYDHRLYREAFVR
jgi:hypothetical protein